MIVSFFDVFFPNQTTFLQRIQKKTKKKTEQNQQTIPTNELVKALTSNNFSYLTRHYNSPR